MNQYNLYCFISGIARWCGEDGLIVTIMYQPNFAEIGRFLWSVISSKLNFDICHSTLHYETPNYANLHYETPNYANLYCGTPYHATYYIMYKMHIMYKHFPNLLQCLRNVIFNYYFSSLKTIRLTVKTLVHLKPSA